MSVSNRDSQLPLIDSLDFLYFSLSLVVQEVSDELEGECHEFEAVPGRGLKCLVSGMEDYTQKMEWKYSRVISRENCVDTNINLMVQDIEMGTSSRVYKVSIYIMPFSAFSHALDYIAYVCCLFICLFVYLQVLIGNREWMTLNDVNMEREVIEEKIKGFEDRGNTIILVAIDGNNYYIQCQL